MRDESLYHEYANWKLEYHDLLTYLVDNHSDLILRFKHVIDVIDHLYDRLIDDPEFSEEENNIFETGFYYMLDQMDEITKLLKIYKNDIQSLEARAKEVNLLLSAIDFQNELLGSENFDQTDMDKLVDFEQQIFKKIENKEDIPEHMYEELDQLSYDLFKKLNIEYYPVNSIFLEIADELGIL